MKIGAQVDPPEERFSLPHDIDYHAFTKFTNIYFKVRCLVFCCRMMLASIL